MKKVLVVILSVIMLLSLFACAGGGRDETSAAPASSPSAAAPPSAAPSQQPSAEPSEPVSVEGSVATTGWYPDALEASKSRDPYKIVYISIVLTDLLHANMDIAFKDWCEYLNCEYTSCGCNGDSATLLDSFETFATQGYDEFLFDCGIDISMRLQEMAFEYDVAWMPALSPFFNTDMTSYSYPAVVVDNNVFGTTQIDYFVEHYKDYFGADTEMSQIGVIYTNFSPNTEINMRYEGALARYTELYPDLVESNFIGLDVIGAGGPSNYQGAFDEVSATITANTLNYDYWFIAMGCDEFGIGASRAVESLGLIDKCIIISCFGDSPLTEWQQGTKTSWIASCTTSQYLFAEPMLCGLLALLDGRSTYKTLWQDSVPAGETYGLVKFPAELLTPETMDSYITSVEQVIAAKYPELTK